MQTVLYKYLALYKNLNIPGIGNFVIHQAQPQLQFTDKKLQPPQSNIAFTPVVYPINNHFYSFLSREWNVEKVIAIRRFKDKAESLIEQLKSKKVCELDGIGTLRKNDDNNVAFAAVESPFHFYSILPAERVVRKHAQHKVLVGEREHIKEYNSTETAQEMMYEEKEAKPNWKLYAIMVAVVSVLLIVLYYAMYAGS